MQEGGATEVTALLDVGGYGTRSQCGDVDSGLSGAEIRCEADLQSFDSAANCHIR